MLNPHTEVGFSFRQLKTHVLQNRILSGYQVIINVAY